MVREDKEEHLGLFIEGFLPCGGCWNGWKNLVVVVEEDVLHTCLGGNMLEEDVVGGMWLFYLFVWILLLYLWGLLAYYLVYFIGKGGVDGNSYSCGGCCGQLRRV